ncbi:nitronate monooxygenase [Corynebacterium sp. p3-SID1241]|uniref:nitronate monooxygenase n=1 Tax=Corynebacterium sp. p3-SID1241 TaxID=2916102 RepID=UPI0021A8D275|nr:nitronate monooxygenase [Corynebacterium sp. p3-SID1241]MCT1428477.1 nitronate monooxygenase [Corynebacterium sp. p3-SID1241]
MSQVISSLSRSVIPAPMAGGPTTPELVHAAHAVGSFGTLGLGSASIDSARTQIEQCAGIPFGVNLFCPQDPLLEPYLASARELAQAESQPLPEPDYSFGFEEKLELALRGGARVVWSMFGTLTPEQIERIHSAGAEAWTTVTTPAEATAAARRGVDALCVQGPAAGGHRGTWDLAATPDSRDLEELVSDVHTAAPDLPLIAAGGLRTAADVANAMSWDGVGACSCGSAFLLTEEAGTSDYNRRLICNGGETVTTRAFSGRYARGLETDYTRSHPNLPPVYPLLNPVLKERRAQHDDAVAYCLVGTEVEKINGGTVANILNELCQNPQ